ncbi:MAG TPA: DNA repair protein RadA [Candidatus Wirthbacteria bacterium]|nr:DNA repair protein RadA [Candidatus Wirthbacteria bacterium]
MAQPKTMFVCQNCAQSSLKWLGQCPGCGQWNTLVEEIIDKPKANLSRAKTSQPLKLEQINIQAETRITSSIQEFDRTLGGGIVPGSLVLLGGEPGIGKSTLTLALLAGLPDMYDYLYITGEESLHQVKMRAQRLQINNPNLSFVNESDADSICQLIKETKPKVIILDSIQSITTSDLASPAGSVGQVRECANRLGEIAKQYNISLLMIGHVTKEGNLAGPKTLEHLVDTVLYLEGEKLNTYRILRATKNRFGSLSEIGLFEMKEQGLLPIDNPATLFTSHQSKASPGSCATVTLEGTRPLVIEIQALTTPSNFGYPKRTASGFSLNRLQLLIAVLTKHANLRLTEQDVYLNLVAGYQINETAADLAVCLAIASSLKDKPLNNRLVALGEISLSGHLKSVSNLEARIKESIRLGYKKALLPEHQFDKINRYSNKIELICLSHVSQILTNLI